MSEKLPYQTLLEGDLPLWVMRFVKATGRAINRYSMIRDGDTVLLSASGGKDSLALALALSLRKKWLPIDYELKAVMINWKEHPIPEEYRKAAVFFTHLGYAFIADEEQYPSSFGGINHIMPQPSTNPLRPGGQGIVKIAMDITLTTLSKHR